jgi:head-tail adaptor
MKPVQLMKLVLAMKPMVQREAQRATEPQAMRQAELWMATRQAVAMQWTMWVEPVAMAMTGRIVPQSLRARMQAVVELQVVVKPQRLVRTRVVAKPGAIAKLKMRWALKAEPFR